MGLKQRFGSVFLWVGIVLLGLFAAASVVQVQNLDVRYLLFGIAFTAFGAFLSISGRKPPEESGRFRTLRKLTGRRKGEGDGDEAEEED